MSIYNSFQDSFNGALRGGALLQGILHNSENREFQQQVRRADEFARGLDGLSNQYGSVNPKDWDDAGRTQLNDLMNEYPDLAGERPGGKATYNSIVPTGDGVAAIVSVDDGKGGGSTGPITKRGSSDDDDEVVILSDVNKHLKEPIVNNLRLQRAKMAARVNSPNAHKMISDRENQGNMKNAFETYNAGINNGAAAPQDPVQTPPSPDAPQAPAPAIEDGPAEGLQSASAVNPPAVTSPGPQPPSTPQAATGRQYTGPAFQPELTDAIGKHAESRGLDPALIQAVVHAESSGNVGAFNGKASATGLMQMTPIGLKEFNIQYGKNYTMEDMKDQDKNLEAGTGLLKYYSDKFDGNEEQALAAYNGGPTRLRKNGGDISKMPPETRDYVGKIIGMVSGSGEAQAAEAPSAEPRGLDTAASEPSAPAPGPSTQDQMAPRSRGRGRNKANHSTPEERIAKRIATAEKERTELEAKPVRGGRGNPRAGRKKALAEADANIAALKAEANEGAEKAAAEKVAAGEATAHEEELQGFIDSFKPRNDGQKKVVDELKSTPAPTSEADVIAAGEQVKTLKPASKTTKEQREAVYTMHRIDPAQFPIEKVISFIETGRMTARQVKYFKNAANQTIEIDDATGAQRVVGSTPQSQAFINLKLMSDKQDLVNTAVTNKATAEKNQLAQTKGRTEFFQQQSVNRHGNDPELMARETDMYNTTIQTVGLNPDAQGTQTAVNRAAEVQHNFNEDNGPAWWNLWMKDEPYQNDFSMGLSIQNMPNSPYDPLSPDKDERTDAANYWKEEYLDPIIEKFPGLSKQQQVQASYLVTHIEKGGQYNREESTRIAGGMLSHKRFAKVGDAFKAYDLKMADHQK